MPQSPAADVFDEIAADYDADGSHVEVANRLVSLAAFPAATLAALDISPTMIARARTLADTEAVRDRVRWICAPAIPFPADDGSADLVLCASTLHFLGLPAVEDWRRVLRPDGVAAFTLPWRDRFRPGPTFAALFVVRHPCACRIW